MGPSTQLWESHMHGWITVFAPLAMLAGAAVLASLVMLLWRVPVPDFQLAVRGPGWSWLGGAAGVFYITAALMLAPRMGSGPFMAAVIGGQMLAALAIDRYGLLGFAVKHISPLHWAGAGLVVAGVILTQVANTRTV